MSLFLALIFTMITATTMIKITPNGMDKPNMRGRLTDEDEEEDGLNPFATKAVDWTWKPENPFPTMLEEAEESTAVGSDPEVVDILPPTMTDPDVNEEKEIKFGLVL